MPINIRIGVIIPKRLMFDYNKWTREIRRVMHAKTEPDLKSLFRGTVEGWKHPPTFWAHHFQTPSSVGVQVYARQSQYAIVNAGSPAHLIRAKRGRMLSFQLYYSASTQPGSLSSRANYRFGPRYRTYQVRHPGFEARKFDEGIKEAYEPTFVADMMQAFEGGLP